MPVSPSMCSDCHHCASHSPPSKYSYKKPDKMRVRRAGWGQWQRRASAESRADARGALFISVTQRMCKDHNTRAGFRFVFTTPAGTVSECQGFLTPTLSTLDVCVGFWRLKAAKQKLTH
ncbi:hypothetical protein TNIN_349731 [Trichonephila inaurata madagascariensis]|uniref:Uncharacterized protein n=1 Tax=Trichonephila inaurata madagascariensis TaxID=2747483 RepID=A0A8X7BVE8_9ARAC|nr:hypothetical protein TNIN_349731 [Trichonephila inaurata madagascariensis]